MLGRAAFVGRAGELALAGECLAAAAAGSPRVVLCLGEAGIGKTRLAEEALGQASGGGLLGVWGIADDTSGTPPYWPWRQVLRALAGHVDVGALAEEQRTRATLGRLAPDVLGIPGGAPGPDMVAGAPVAPELTAASAEERFGQFDAFARLLRQICLIRPVAVVLDDAHWADEASLLLLRHVVLGLTGERLLLWVNARDTSRRFGELAERWSRSPAARQIHLGGLPESAVREQLVSITGHEVAAADVAEAVELTGGNPFLVGETARRLLDRRRDRAGLPVTHGARDAVSARLARVSAPCRGLLAAAAILGREFGTGLAAATAGVSAADCPGWLEEAERAGLVEPARRPGDYRFVHALVRDAIEAALNRGERQRLHQRAAQDIEARQAGLPGTWVFDIARHWAEAAPAGPDQASTAARWLERAADTAMGQMAYEDAAHWYQEALRIGGGVAGYEHRCRLLLAAARAMSRYGALSGRFEACLEAAAVGREHGRPDIVAEAALVMEPVGRAGFDLTTRRLCQEAMDGLGPEPAALRARVTARFAETFIYLPETSAGRTASEQALAVAERCRDAPALASALRARQVMTAGPEGLAERARLAARMLELGRDTTDAQVEMRGWLCQADVCFERGDLSGAATAAEAAARCAEVLGGPLARFWVTHTRAVLAQAQGRFADCRRLADRAQVLLGPAEHPARVHRRAAVLGILGRHAGQDRASLAANGCLDGTEGPHPDPDSDPGLIAVLARADVLVTAGRPADAAAAYRSYGPPSGWQIPPHVTLLSAAFGVEVAAALGALDDVGALHRRLAAYRGHHVACGLGAAGYLGPVELWLGKAARYLGRLDDAVIDLEQAVRLCESNGAAGFQAEARYELAATLAARGRPGDRAAAAGLAATAAAQAGELGMGPIAARIAALAASLDEPHPVLTPRERQVAELVAGGLTNREIAGQLFVSERTAQNHVQHILTKLNLPNRGQIALWVERSKNDHPGRADSGNGEDVPGESGRGSTREMSSPAE